MSVTLDTNCLIRFFTDDDKEKATKVQSLIDSEKQIKVPDVVFPELEYVLTDGYKVSRQDLVTIYRFLLSKKNIKVSSIIRKAFIYFENSKLDMADCIIAAVSYKGKLASFDRKLLQLEDIVSYF